MNQRPSPTDLLCDQAVEFHKKGNLAEAEKRYLQVLAAEPAHFVAAHSLGVIRIRQGRNDEALQWIGTALNLAPDSIPALANYGLALQGAGRFAEALASFDKTLALMPGHPDLLYNRGIALWDLGRFAEALASYDEALAVKPDFAEVWNNRGNALRELGRFDEALTSFSRAITLRPNFAEALYNRANALAHARRFDEALADYNKTLAINPGYARAYVNRGNVLQTLRRFDEALANYDRALAIKPDAVNALNNRGNVLFEMKRTNEALVNYEKALTLQPDNVSTLVNRGNALKLAGRLEEAAGDFERALQSDPAAPGAFGGLAHAALHLCDWNRTRKIAAEMEARVVADQAVGPLVLLGYCDDPALQLRCAQTFIQNQLPVRPRPLWTGTSYRHERIRIAYLSADFYKHATALLMAELFERHDRSRFEVLGLSFGPDDGSAMRARLVKAFDGFHDVRGQSDQAAAKTLRGLEVDIAIDLKGYTADARPEILSHRPCPVQANYLGYPGTMGADFIDYVIADATVLPFDRQPFYSEKIVHLPDCYQVNDSMRPIAARTPTRLEAGLPESGMVFCAFNSHWKIAPPVFDIWMRLLAAVSGSVLWLIAEGEASARNLCAEAASRGIDPKRLIFAPKMENDAHLARHRLADLFLDTLPYNAHTTASDALWAGLPVITCAGEGFAARVAASLLHAAGLAEMVTQTLADYEALALALARDPARLRSIRTRLERDRLIHPLFDTGRFCRNIEAAYTRMLGAAQRGLPPQSFRVTPEGEAVG